ncbi:COG4223 family protein [Rhizobium sp. SAFR-030]|uniref:COG4223 family protein n=1 Tax=Rhizobium sp. SAFR-030 TaxID=3387277 RepID=UPI003F811130
MVSEKPPRRSRPGKTPVTIDLAADEVGPIAEPVRSDDTDAVTAKQDAVADKGPAQSTPADGEPVTSDPTATVATPSPQPAPKTLEPKAPGPKTPEPKMPNVSASTASTGGSVLRDPVENAKPAPAKAPTMPPTVLPKAAGPGAIADKPIGAKPLDAKPVEAKPLDTKPSEPKPESPVKTPIGAGAPPPPKNPPEMPRPASEAPRPTSATTPPQKSSLGPALVASGIIGGLVSLLLAGSMQYAGYLPAPSSQPSAASSAELDALRQQIAGLEARPAADGNLSDRIAALEAAGSTDDAGQLNEQVAALRSELDGLKTASQTQTAGRAELDQRIAAVETKVDQPGPEQAVALALAAAALKSATERGGSFEAELQTLASVAPADAAVEGLRPFAAEGVPTQAELVRRLPAASGAILDAIHQPPADQGIAGRLMSSAMRMVTVRPVGNVEGDTPEAIIARLEERVRTGDLKAAQTEWNALPEAGRQAGADFGRALDARIKVDDLTSGTLTRAMTSAGSNG